MKVLTRFASSSALSCWSFLSASLRGWSSSWETYPSLPSPLCWAREDY